MAMALTKAMTMATAMTMAMAITKQHLGPGEPSRLTLKSPKQYVDMCTQKLITDQICYLM